MNERNVPGGRGDIGFSDPASLIAANRATEPSETVDAPAPPPPPPPAAAAPAPPIPSAAPPSGPGIPMPPNAFKVNTPSGGGFLQGLGFRGIGILVFIGLAVIGGIANRGTTSADELGAGDCFLMTDADEISRLDTPDCAEEHDSQILAVVDVPRSGEYPGDLDPYWDQVYDECLIAADLAIQNWDNLPEDTIMDMLTPVASGWAVGDRESICFIHSPGGLLGSYVIASS